MDIGDLAVGETARVTGFQKGSGSYRAKLLAMGMTRGQMITVKRAAPMGDPVEIVLRGTAVVLRRDEAAAILVERS